MDFWKTIFGLARRKAIGPPLAALSLVSAALVFFLIPTYYVSTASMVLTTPATGGTLSADPTRPLGLTNPLLQFSDGLRVTAGILILSMNTPEVSAELGVTPDGPTQIVINDGRTNPELLGISTNGPFVYVEVQSRSAPAAQDVVLRAKERIRRELANRQQALKAPRSTFITVVDVVPSSVPTAKISGKLTAAGATMFVVLFGGLSIVYGVTQIRAGRRRPPGQGQAVARDEREMSDEQAWEAAGAGYGSAIVDGDPPVAIPRVPAVSESGEGPFQDDSTGIIVVVDDEDEPLDRHDQSADTIVFTRAGWREENEK
ncbi:hypothetical protein AB0395_23660 [Streptosporangium sp. NPDC051023]|uniref:hypothetical protein n=1 Tax=Streptosporangium sp. NPDC051023 TaxID=3155410 RepID=UPI00344D70C3